MNKQPNSEKGQVLVLIVLAVVGLMGFAALAVDLSRVAAERRRAQGAADAAAFAGAFADSQGQDYISAATASLQANGFTDAHINVAGDRPSDARVISPPEDGPYKDDPEYFQVKIYSLVDKVFAQFIFQGLLTVNVEAVSRAQPITAVFPEQALISTSPFSCQAVKFTGTGGTEINGGGVYSNSNAGSGASCTPNVVNGPGGNSCASGVQGGSGTVKITNGAINLVGPWLVEGGASNATATGGINQCVPSMEIPTLPVPDCSNLPARSYSGGDETLYPGVYAGGIKVTSAILKLKPGMYCLDDDFTMTGGSISGTGVMFVMRGGQVQLGGNTKVNINRPNSIVDGLGQQWGGMLIYMPYANTNEVHIGGGSGSRYTGTIYAPGPRDPESQDKCVIEGSGDSVGLASNVICYNVKITGSAKVIINYIEKQNYRMPPRIELSQ